MLQCVVELNYNNVNTQTGTYSDDAIGNITADRMQGVSNVEWNVYGKVKNLINSNDENVTYTYSSDGQRISKKVGDVVEWYVRDASGNVMSVYVKDASVNNNHLTQNDWPTRNTLLHLRLFFCPKINRRNQLVTLLLYLILLNLSENQSLKLSLLPKQHFGYITLPFYVIKRILL